MADDDRTRNATTAALDTYAAKLKQPPVQLTARADLECLVSDLVADLMHYADRCGFDADHLVIQAANHFHDER